MRLPIRILDVAVIGLVFPVASILGFVAGQTVGEWCDAPKTGAMVGFFFGVAAGFYNAYQTVRRASLDDEEEERDGFGQS